MPRSKSKKMRQRATQKGRRGQLAREHRVYARRLQPRPISRKYKRGRVHEGVIPLHPPPAVGVGGAAAAFTATAFKNLNQGNMQMALMNLMMAVTSVRSVVGEHPAQQSLLEGRRMIPRGQDRGGPADWVDGEDWMQHGWTPTGPEYNPRSRRITGRSRRKYGGPFRTEKGRRKYTKKRTRKSKPRYGPTTAREIIPRGLTERKVSHTQATGRAKYRQGKSKIKRVFQ
jgi:hypothetical protein